MNKNTLIGILLIGVILFGFSWYNNKQYSEQLEAKNKAAREQLVRDSIAAANAPKVVEVIPTAEQLAADSLRKVEQQLSIGELAKAKEGTEEFTTLESPLFKLTFSNRGGRIAAVELKDYKKYNGDPLMLFTDKGSHFGLTFYAPERINTAELFFTVSKQTTDQITYRLTADSLNYKIGRAHV